MIRSTDPQEAALLRASASVANAVLAPEARYKMNERGGVSVLALGS